MGEHTLVKMLRQRFTMLIKNGGGRFDDGDGFLTKFEVKKPTTFLGLSLYYPFNPVADDPSTPENEFEPKGIPSKDIIDIDTNEPDGTTLTRLRRHLDKTAKPPYNVY